MADADAHLQIEIQPPSGHERPLGEVGESEPRDNAPLLFLSLEPW
jgi:hypothetical protein